MPMGSKCLFDIVIDSTPPGIIEREIIRRVEANTGRKSGRWEATVTLYGPDEKRKRPIQVVSLSDVTDRLYMMLPTHVTEVEPSMVTLMLKISALKQRMKRVVRGEQYDFEDFCVRVGVSFDKQNAPHGVVVEIEYRPCAFVSECEQVIKEMMDKIVAPLVPPPTPSNDPSVGAAAGNKYEYRMINIEDNSKKIRKSDLIPYSHRTSAWLYSTLLGANSAPPPSSAATAPANATTDAAATAAPNSANSRVTSVKSQPAFN